MATNDNRKDSTSVSKVTKNTTTPRTNPQDVATVAQQGSNLLQNMHKDIVTNEAQRDADIDAMEAKAIEAHMKMLEDHSIPIEKRQEILDKYYSRVDKQRQHADKKMQENTKRWNATLWWATFCVLGVAALKYAPGIIDAFNKNKRI